MTEVLVTSITAAATVVVAVIANRGRQHAKAGREAAEDAREQVQNSHKSNLRDDLDALSRKVDDLAETVHRYHRRRGIRRLLNR